MSEEPPRKVGYKNPPVHTQFKKGDKPKGKRPKGSRNKKSLAQEAVAESLLAISDEPHGLTEGGKRKRLSRLAIGWTRLNNMAASKDDKAAIKLLFSEYHKLQKIASATKSEPYPFSDLDRQVINEMYERMKLCEPDEMKKPNSEVESDDALEREFNRVLYGPGKESKQ